VAGTIGAASNNNVGVTGINWQAKLLPVRVLGKCGGLISDIVDGMRWAAGIDILNVPHNSNPARVINISLGGIGSCSAAEQSAINDVVNRGAVVVVAAGNDNQDAATSSPANCANVISVAATNRAGSRAFYSDFGRSITISAPGGGNENDPNDAILSTIDSGAKGPVSPSYAYYIGTSMATPHVTGVVSLMFSIDSALTPAQVRDFLQNNVTSFPAGSTCATTSCGAGIVNAAAVVKAVQNKINITPSPTSTSTPPLTATPTATPNLTVTPTASPTLALTAVATPVGSSTQNQKSYLPLIYKR
jgi:serine protease